MPETEEQTTAAFQVQREDGSRFVLTEVATFLVHEGDGHRVPCQIEWFVDGKSVIRDRHVFKNLVTGEIFRIVRPDDNDRHGGDRQHRDEEKQRRRRIVS